MKRQGTTVAKLARPSGREWLPRERLFAALDGARAGRIAWVTAPGGSGKTSLIASWIEARKLRCLWLSLDAGDADPASLFYYLALGARRLGVTELPASGAAARVPLGVFARRFAEQLFATAPEGLVLVLDSYHALSAEAAVHEAVDALFDAIPPGALAVVASRAGPPARLARWAASDALRTLGWPELQLTPEESAALAGRNGVAPGERREAIHELARGWAAGVVLLARAPTPVSRPPCDAPTQAVFDYFATEVFGGVPARTRDFLVRTAFLPRMTPKLTHRVAAEPEAAALLEELHRTHLFTDRRDGGEPTYEYHPLFRDFLQRQAAKVFDPDVLRALRAASAVALADAGDGEAAAALHVANEDWAGLARLVRARAEALAAHGRHATVAEWIGAVPAVARDAEPWLVYWLGRCQLALRVPGARDTFASAFTAFERSGDAEGAFSSCAWLLRSSATAADAARWIAAAERIAAAHPGFDDPHTEVRVIAQFLLVHQFPPRHPLVERFAARAETLARTLEGAAERTRMAAFALSVPTIHADLRRLAMLAAEMQALAARDDAPPGDLAILLLFRGNCQLQFDDLPAAAATIARMQRLAAATGSIDVFTSTWYLAYRAAVLTGDVDRARECAARLQQAGGLPPPLVMHIATVGVYLALIEGDAPRGIAGARAVLDSAGNVMPDYRPLWHANLGQALLAQGEREAALHEIEVAIATARTWRLEGMLVSAQLLRAAALLQLGSSEEAVASLREGFAGARALGCVPHMPFVLPGTLAQLAAMALGHGIERDFVCRTIARRALPPPAAEEERWPWRVRVRALGAFETAVGGEPLENGTKPQRKPIELLKYVIAAGGRDVGVGAVTQALWPDAEGDAAKRSFDVTLHRLRRMLGHDDAITLYGGKLALNPGIVWVDALAFERLAGRLDDAQRGVRDGPAAPIELLERALRLYRGPLLASDEEHWVRPARERLRRQFVQLAEAAGEHWERAANTDAALAWYHRAIDLEPTAERIHQRILRLLHGQGRRAEALEAYRRCREVLGAILAAAPSPETEALHRLVRS
jgi:DNA-binding SARP family transcriptional activator